MTTIFPRQWGVKLTCDRCGKSVATAMCGRKQNRTYWATQGWGRGSDPGQAARTALRDRGTVVDSRGRERKLHDLPEVEGRERTTKHDLCPKCLKLDRAAAAERKERRAKQIVARDAARKARAQIIRAGRDARAAQESRVSP
jgi:ribosomal protein S27AE